MESYSERLKYLISLLGLTENAFANDIGYDRADTIYHVIKGKTKDPRVSMSHRIKTRYPQVNLNWLDGGVGEPFIDTAAQNKMETKIKELEKRAKDAEETLALVKLLLKDRLTDDERKTIGL